MCLTKDEKYLLVGSGRLMKVFETTTRELIKEFDLINVIIAIILVKNGKYALIAEQNGNLTTINLETLEISSIAKNITFEKEFNISVVI